MSVNAYVFENKYEARHEYLTDESMWNKDSVQHSSMDVSDRHSRLHCQEIEVCICMCKHLLENLCNFRALLIYLRFRMLLLNVSSNSEISDVTYGNMH